MTTDEKEGEMPNAIIVYDTRKGSTQLMAEAIQAGMEESGVEATSKRIYEVDAAELAGYACLVLGSPTYHKDMIQTMKTFLFKLEQVDLKGKIGASFGAYGWSGEAVGMLSGTMKHIFGMDVLEPREKLTGKADEFGKGQHRELGRKIAAKIKEQEK
jgi:flavorubredoxin